MNTCSKQQFLGGAMALTFSTVLVKIIGLVYKIPLMRCLGAEGMGYFNSAYELYTLFFVIATAGIPVAISIMISESIAVGRLKNAEKIYKTSFCLLLFVGAVGSLFMCFGARWLAGIINSPGSAKSLVLVAPTVFFISISGAIRGFFQGHRNMVPTAISQVVESLGKLALGIALAFAAKKNGCGVEETAAFAILGLTLGTMISTAYLCVSGARARFSFERRILENSCESSMEISSRLVKLAVPVTVSSILVSLSRIVDMYMLMNRLGSDVDKISVYGSYSTMALPVYNLPSSLVAGIALALVPSITNAVKAGQKEREEKLAVSGIKLCAVIALPASFGMCLYSREILQILFADEDIAVSLASPLLSVLGASVLSSCLTQVTSSVLQANGKIMYPIKAMLSGLLVKLASSYFLIGIPSLGAMGAPISTLLCNLTAVSLNFYYLSKYTSFNVRLSSVLAKPACVASLSALISVAAYFIAAKAEDNVSISFVAAAIACGVSYLVLTVKFYVLDAEEYQMLPLGNRILTKIIIKEEKNEQRRKNHRAFEKRKISL